VARNTYEAWIPEQFGSTVLQRVHQVSALEAYAQRIPMQTQTRSTPRSGGVSVGMVAKGGTYSEDTSTNDEAVLREQKFGQAIRIAEEDINDSLADVVSAKQNDWATSYAKTLDNACLAVTAAKGTSGCAFDSLYYLLTQTDAATGYTANTNITASATGAPAAGAIYTDLSVVSGLYEAGDFFSESDTLIMAHPKFKAIFRGVKDSQNRPIFQEGSTGVPGGGQGGVVDTVFGYPVKWTLGAKTSAVPTQSPTGNPLLIIGNPMYLLLGVRSGPESVFIDGRNGLGALTDESILKMRARRGFVPGTENAFSIYEYKGT
jgi:HK97 family phage major capsid protein